MSKVFFIIIAVLSVILWSCSDEDPAVTIGSTPNITEITVNDKWNPRLQQKYKIEVRVQDPQGPDNITGVLLAVKRDSAGSAIFSDSLYDDGAYYNPEDGDVLARDGIFSNRFLPTEISNPPQPGLYIFEFIAHDANGNQSQQLQVAISFGENSPPEIVNISTPDSFSVFALDSIITVTVSDSNGIEDISAVYFESRKKGIGSAKLEQFLYDNGDPGHGDAIAGDSVFSTILKIPFLVGKTGLYELFFYAEDSFDEINELPAVRELSVSNYAPEFNSLNVPALIQVPAQPQDFTREIITATVSDPETLADISQVYFYSLRPDSVLANGGRPIQLRDNGLPFNINNAGEEVGDELAGDGVYTFSLVAFGDTSITMRGEYRLTFYTSDKAGNRIGPVEKNLTIQ